MHYKIREMHMIIIIIVVVVILFFKEKLTNATSDKINSK